MIGYVYRIFGTMGVVYIGSTKCISLRKANHKRSCIISKLPLYTFIQENGGWEAFKMEVMEEVEYTDRKELHQRERFHIEDLKPIHNKNIPTRTSQEYSQTPEAKLKNREKNRERYRNNPEQREYAKKYYAENKDRIKKQVKDWRQENVDHYKELQRKWKEKNPNYMKEYTKKNKDRIL